jgi:hypothetical protein
MVLYAFAYNSRQLIAAATEPERQKQVRDQLLEAKLLLLLLLALLLLMLMWMPMAFAAAAAA